MNKKTKNKVCGFLANIKLSRAGQSDLDDLRSRLSKALKPIDIKRENFEVLDKGNWGSIQDGSKSVYLKENVIFEKNYVGVIAKRSKDPIVGKRHNGDEEVVMCSSGFAKTKMLFSRGMQLSLACEIIDNGEDQNGHWPAVWLFREGDQDTYLETDLMERFCDLKRSKNYIWTTFHYRYKKADEQKMISQKIRMPKLLYMLFQFNWDFNDNITVTLNGVDILKVNNVDINYPYMHLIISNAISNDAIRFGQEYALKVSDIRYGVCDMKI